MKFFKLLYIILIIASIGVLCFINLQEWVWQIGTDGFWFNKIVALSVAVQLGAILGLFMRNRFGWVLVLLFFYALILFFISMYVAYFGPNLQFLPFGIIITMVLAMGLIFLNSRHLKNIYKLPSDTPVLKLNLIIGCIAGALVWYSIQYYAMNW